jgi:hypothetical protein
MTKRFAATALLICLSALSATAGNILLYDDNTNNQNAQAALADLGLAFTLANSGNFNTLLTGEAWNLVILDLPSTTPSGGFGDLITHISGGGKALMSFWNLQGEAALAAAFEVSVASSFSSPVDVSAWDGAHAIFNNPNLIALPLSSWVDDWADDGDRLNALGTAVALAGFTGAPAAGEAAIVLGNGGRTLYNGFLWDEFGTDQNGRNLIGNQVVFLLDGTSQVPEPSTFLLLSGGIGALFLLRRRVRK